MSQKLRGLIAQSMSGGRKSRSPLSYLYVSDPALAKSYTFLPTKAGWWRFVLWGGGGGNQGTIGSGAALVIAERPLVANVGVLLSVGSGEFIVGNGFDTTVTFPWGEVLTAGGGKLGGSTPGGVAVGNTGMGDILVNGDPSTTTPGAGASYGRYLGGPAGGALNPSGGFPGGGVRAIGSSAQGGNGLIMIEQVRLRP